MPPRKQPSRNPAEKPQASKVPAGSTGKSAPKPRRVVPQKKEASIPSFLDFVEPPPQDDDMDAELTQGASEERRAESSLLDAMCKFAAPPPSPESEDNERDQLDEDPTPVILASDPPVKSTQPKTSSPALPPAVRRAVAPPATPSPISDPSSSRAFAPPPPSAPKPPPPFPNASMMPPPPAPPISHDQRLTPAPSPTPGPPPTPAHLLIPALPAPPAPPLTPAPPLPPAPPPSTPSIHINPPMEDAMTVDQDRTSFAASRGILASTFISAPSPSTGPTMSSATSGSSSALPASSSFATTSSSAERMLDQGASQPDEQYEVCEPSLDNMRARALTLHAELLAMVRELEEWDGLVERRINSRKYKAK